VHHHSPIIQFHSNPYLKTIFEGHNHITLQQHYTTRRKKEQILKDKMSWQTYVDEHLMCDIDGTGHHLSAAAIIGHDGSVWAQSSSFPQVYS